MPENRSLKTRQLALNGILGALTVISVFLATVMPTNRLSFFALSSFFVCIVIIEYGIKNGWAFYVSTSLLAGIMVPNKIEVLPYIAFFGIYGILKSYIEKINKVWLEYFVKLIYFNLCLAVAIILAREFFIMSINIEFPWWIAIVLLQFAFFIYDYVYSLFIQYYLKRLKKLFRI